MVQLYVWSTYGYRSPIKFKIDHMVLNIVLKPSNDCLKHEAMICHEVMTGSGVSNTPNPTTFDN